MPRRCRTDRLQQHRFHARHLCELVDAGAVRQRRNYQRGIGVGRARHQVAQVVRHHERHLPVGEHGGLGSPGGAGGEEEPARIVVLDEATAGASPRWRATKAS